MPRPFRFLVRALILGALLATLLLSLVLSATPTVLGKREGWQRDLANAKSVLRSSVQNNTEVKTVRTIALTADDLTAVANFALLRKHWQGNAETRIHGRRLDFKASVRLPLDIANLYLNLKVIADDAEPQAQITQIKLGHLALPRFLIYWLGQGMMSHTPFGRFSQLAAPLWREIRISGERLQVTLNWNREALEQAQLLVTDIAGRERLLAYHARLAEALQDAEVKKYVALGRLMQALFALAHTRSELPDTDAMEENRALILVLGAYANGRDLLRGMSAQEAPPLPYKGVLLHRRIDMAQHFMASAALAISGHRTLADLVGLAKEINDTHSGSGFSFIDLTADRAGAMFGRAAMKSDEEARRLQRILSRSQDEGVFMPGIRDLPENLGPADFAARFGDIDSPEFQALKQQIEERIAACALYQPD